MDISPGTAREEAERLVAAVLAAATLAANANPHLATGSPECCVCPLQGDRGRPRPRPRTRGAGRDRGR
ncbi:hypothetical protein ACFQZ4_14990 [Catellatospora coxensis]